MARWLLLPIDLQLVQYHLFSSTDNILIAGIQLEVGEQATPFEHRSFGEELELCKDILN